MESNQTKEFVDSCDPLLESCPSESEFQGKARQCEGCPGQNLCKKMSNSDTFKLDVEKLRVRMSAIQHKILIVSGKGGVGKSTTAVSIALALSEKGKKVGILDVDICGPSIPRLLNIQNEVIVNTSYGWLPIKSKDHDLSIISVGSMLQSLESPVVWRGPRKTNLIKRFLKDTYWGRLDFLIIDTPPGTSDEHISIMSALKNANPDGAIIVTTPQEIALSTIKKELNFCNKMNFPVLGIIENMSEFVCPCCNETTNIFMKSGGKNLAKEYSITFLGEIPLDPRVTECMDKGMCIFCNNKNSAAVD